MSEGLYFVAGGTSGIGRACALALLRDGHRVVAIGRHQKHADELAVEGADAGIQGALTVLAGDLADPEFATSAAASAPSDAVVGLINAAGSISRGGISVETPTSWRHVMSANLDAAFNLTKALLPRLCVVPGAAIVNVSSTCGQRPCDSLSYSVSKAGLDMFTKHLARDLAADGIRVNSVNPGAVRTNLQLSSGVLSPDDYELWLAGMAKQHPLGLGSVDDVRAAIMFLLSAEARWITGATLYVDGGRATT